MHQRVRESLNFPIIFIIIFKLNIISPPSDHYVERYMVRVGSSKHGSGGLLKEVKRIVAHKEFNTVKYNYDLAVLELISDIRFDNTKRPINLPTQGQQLPDKVILDISGWGLTKNHNETRDHLRRVSLVLVNKNDCEKVYNPDYFSPNITDQMLCATSPGKDKCDGDSGGPLNKNNTLFGVASWGGGEGCGKAGYPGVYSKVAAAVDWIRGVMNGTIS